MNHLMLAARSGYEMSMKGTGEAYKKGHITKDEYARILALWGDKTQHHAWYEDPDHHQIQYVTNRAMPELGGKRGIFPRGELEWHCNGTLALDPEDCVTLYCVVPTKDR